MANYDVLKERSKSCPKVLIRGESYVFDVDRVINFLVNKLGMERDAAIDVVADVMDAISQTGSEEISGEYIKGLLEGKALPVLKKDMDYYFNPAAESLLEERYYKPGENWPALCRRVASFLSDNPADEEWYYNKLIKCDVLLNSPALMNAGTRLGYLSACNFLEVQDDMEDILENAKRAGLIARHGGGVGFNFSKLRPTGDRVSEKGTSSGTISFMEIYDKIGDVVKQGLLRRSAHLGLLYYKHPDVLRWLHAKDEKDKLTTFNILYLSIPAQMRHILPTILCWIWNEIVFQRVNFFNGWPSLCGKMGSLV